MTSTSSQRHGKTDAGHFKRLLSARLEAMERGIKVYPYQGSEMLRIRFTFDRIRTNTHLVCIKCNGAIAEKRLLANPTALTCGACEPDNER